MYYFDVLSINTHFNHSLSDYSIHIFLNSGNLLTLEIHPICQVLILISAINQAFIYCTSEYIHSQTIDFVSPTHSINSRNVSFPCILQQ